MKDKSIEQIICDEGFYVSTSCGVSMEPLLRDRQDTIVVSSLKGRLKKYDVVLYRRNGEYVLHRVIRVCKDSYVIRGDNCLNSERGVKDSDVVGILSEVYRGEKQIKLSGIKYNLYCRMIVAVNPFRVFLSKVKRIFKSKA